MAKSVMQPINHLNYPSNNGQIYCRMSNAIKTIGELACSGCPLYYGSIQGVGMECFYPDMITDNNSKLALTVADPAFQAEWITTLIDKELIPADPTA